MPTARAMRKIVPAQSYCSEQLGKADVPIAEVQCGRVRAIYHTKRRSDFITILLDAASCTRLSTERTHVLPVTEKFFPQNLGTTKIKFGWDAFLIKPLIVIHLISLESSANTMLGEPYLFADVPFDFEGNQPQVHAGDVFAVTGSSKRKLPEIACAIDRQGVNIYNVNAVRTHFVLTAEFR